MAPRSKLLLSLAVTVGTVLLVEGGARLALGWLGEEAPIELGWEGQREGASGVRAVLYQPDDRTFFRLRPGVFLEETPRERIFDVRTNSLALRGDEVEIAKRAGVTRVLCVGDSCTFGSGAGHRETFPARLQERLATELGGPVEVLNAGVPGFTSYQGLQWLEAYGLELEPDAVVFTLGYNDCTPAQPGPKRKNEGAPLSDKEYALALASRSPVADLGVTRLWRRLTSPGGDEPPQVVDGSKLRVSLEEYRENLRGVVELCGERGILPVIAAWPVQPQAAGEPMPGRGQVLQRYQQAAMALARKQGATAVDLRRALSGRPEVFIDQVHVNATGYDLVAEALAEALGPVLKAR